MTKPFDQDAELAAKAQQGDRNAFEALVESYNGRIYSFTLNFSRNPDKALDLAQETFLRAYRFLHTYDPSRRFSTWLYSIARNLCIDKHREESRRPTVDIDQVPPQALEHADGGKSPLEAYEESEQRASLMAAVSELPEKYKTPIVLCYMEGLSYQEISEVLGISLNNTKIRIFRAKKILIDNMDFGEKK